MMKVCEFKADKNSNYLRHQNPKKTKRTVNSVTAVIGILKKIAT
jgi:hypothetical protein